VHWGTYPLGEESLQEMRASLARVAASAHLDPRRLVFLAIGETIGY
jgi:hypothetical protein